MFCIHRQRPPQEHVQCRHQVRGCGPYVYCWQFACYSIQQLPACCRCSVWCLLAMTALSNWARQSSESRRQLIQRCHIVNPCLAAPCISNCLWWQKMSEINLRIKAVTNKDINYAVFNSFFKRFTFTCYHLFGMAPLRLALETVPNHSSFQPDSNVLTTKEDFQLWNMSSELPYQTLLHTQTCSQNLTEYEICSPFIFAGYLGTHRPSIIHPLNF